MKKEISHFKTEKGSTYIHLIDGRIQRFKETTGKLEDPMNLTVFLPEYNLIKEKAPKKQLEKIGENEHKYLQMISHYVYTSGKKVHAITEKGTRIEKNSELEDTSDKVYLGFGDNKKTDFYIPISKDPKIGRTPYETTLEERDGEWFRTKHLGHKVTSIT